MHARRIRSTVAAVGAVLAVAFVIAAAAVAAPDPTDRPDPRITDGTAQRRLDAARERWEKLGARSYRMRVRVSCFCPEGITRPRTIIVRRGRPVAPVPEHLRPYATVPRLFTTVQDAIDARVARLTAQYTSVGVPKTIFVDRSFMIADEERGVGVDRFRTLR
ncbi:DUF6174 domain-containing protein [Conexibacter sp. CPCC 206217]|uniref:DUF6174 domain-containing protein n=1 Tax=Conexibacter sp. CPCC 206217 TaxID=3064574 RepID=UPI0027207717|nr:DUF6174 domain-containing protein [Conexibacter sp. CPCC 206217]MDO8213875.1 DUF6174 domain-containing protein [Conexibacter sp. CPCC 206217]